VHCVALANTIKHAQHSQDQPTPPPKMENSPQWIKFSLTLSQMGQIGHLSFACDCQTHGDVTSFVLFLPICATLMILTVCQTTSTKNMCGKNQKAFSAPPFCNALSCLA